MREFIILSHRAPPRGHICHKQHQHWISTLTLVRIISQIVARRLWAHRELRRSGWTPDRGVNLQINTNPPPAAAVSFHSAARRVLRSRLPDHNHPCAWKTASLSDFTVREWWGAFNLNVKALQLRVKMWHMCRNVVFHYAGARKGAVRSRAFDTPIQTRMQPALEAGLVSLTCSVHLYTCIYMSGCMLVINRISGCDGAHWLGW